MYFKNFPNIIYDFDFDKSLDPILATKMVANRKYKIISIGTTDFTKYGASQNKIGTKFNAISVGKGTGKVVEVTQTEETALYLKDITRNVRVRRDILANITMFDLYDIQEGDTPERIAEKVYGNPEYHWIIMLVNERYDYLSDFPLSQVELQNYVEKKYGSNMFGIHHYEDENGFVVDSSYPNANPITNDLYEAIQNESKRTIKIVSHSVIEQILTEFKKIL